MSDPLEKLKAYVELLPDHVPGTLVGNILELDAETGIGYCIGLKKNRSVAVADTVVSIGSKFLMHFHPEKEIMVVYQGAIRLTVYGATADDPVETHYLRAGDVHIIDPNISHNSEALEDSKIIAITIPAAVNFPNAR